MAEPKEVLWEGEVGEDRYRVAGYNNSYGGLAWAVECWDDPVGDGSYQWISISSGPEADPPEVAAVAAAIAREGSDMTRLQEPGALHGRIGELEGALAVLLDQALPRVHFGGGQVAGYVIRLTPDQYQNSRSLVDREEVRDGE